MPYSISDSLLARLKEFVSHRMGLSFPPERWADLDRGIVSAAKTLGSKDPESFVNEILSPPVKRKQIEALASFLTVGESYFFRDSKSFDVLEQHILRNWISSGRNQERKLRIWSAGCATGEEPYSIAILLNRMIRDLEDWDISILATDINPHFLHKARQGLYTEWSFRDVPTGIKEIYFVKTGEGRYRISPHIRKRVAFFWHNLAEDNYPPPLHPLSKGEGEGRRDNTARMDLIFCRNVIMYFSEAARKKVIEKFFHCLVEGGCLVVSPTEVSHALFSKYVNADFPGVAIYRKDSCRVGGSANFVAEAHPLPDLPLVEATLREDPLREGGGKGYPSPSEGGKDSPSPSGEGTGWEWDSEGPRPPADAGAAESMLLLLEEALSLFGLGYYGEAEKKIIEVLSLNPEDSKAMKLLSRIKANQGKLGEALEWCEKVIAADKLNPESHYLCATILQERGKIEQAVLSLKNALYLDPDFVPAHFVLGNLLRQQGNQTDSKRHFRNALLLLKDRGKDELVAGSEEIPAGRFVEIIRSIIPELRIDDL